MKDLPVPFLILVTVNAAEAPNEINCGRISPFFLIIVAVNAADEKFNETQGVYYLKDNIHFPPFSETLE